LAEALTFVLALAFLLFVESNPDVPAPDAGGVNVVGADNRASPSRSNFWKRGGLLGLVCNVAVSGSV